MKKKAFDPLQSVGTGVTRILGRFTPEQWSAKLSKLRDRAEFGDSRASELLSIIGVASVVLGTGAGMYAGSKLGGGSRGGSMLGSAIGGLLGASPSLMNPAKSQAQEPSSVVAQPEGFDPKPWQQSELL